MNIIQLLKKLLEMEDDEPCLCLSGKKYKDCHKLLLGRIEKNPRKLFYEILKIKRKKECLYGKGFDCEGDIVKAHSISKKHLEIVGEDLNHVYSFIKTEKISEYDNLHRYKILPDPMKIGINDVSTFKGLCRKHDSVLFRSFESTSFAYSDDQINALHLRPILKEIFVKTEMALHTQKAQQSILKVTSGMPALVKNAKNVIDSIGSNLALMDLYGELSRTISYINNKDSPKLRYICFEVNGLCPILCSSTVNPAYDLKGYKIQDYQNKDKETQSFSFNIIAEKNVYYIIFSWFPSPEINLFFESLDNRFNSNYLQYLIQMPFAFSENLAIRISWFDSLSEIKRERLKKLFWNDILVQDNGRETIGLFREHEFSTDSIIKILKNY